MTAEIALKKFSSMSAVLGERVKTATDALSKVLFFSLADEAVWPRKGICICIDKGSFSYAAGTRFLGKTTIKISKQYGVEDGSYPTPERLASSVALDLAGEGSSRTAILAIPKTWTIVANAEFPSTVRANLSEVVSFELDRITPLGASEAYFDYRITHEDAHKIRVVVMAARTETVTPYIEALRERGITVERVMCTFEGMPYLLDKSERRTDLIMVEISDRSLEGAIFRDLRVTAAFSGQIDLNDEMRTVQVVCDTVGRHVSQMSAQGASPGVAVILKKPSSRLRELLASRCPFALQTIEQFDGEGSPNKNKRVPLDSALGALTESLQSRHHAMDLLSRGTRPKSKKPLAVTLLLSAVLLGMLVIYGMIPLQIEERRLREIDAQIAQRKDEVKKVEMLKKEVEAVEAEIGAIRDFRQRRPLTLSLIKELTSVIPKSAWLTRIKIGEKTVEIEGYSSNATELLGKLESSAFFEKVEFASPTFRDARQNADKFSIRMTLEETDDDA